MFGMHWHNVFFIVLLIALGTLAILQTIDTSAMIQKAGTRYNVAVTKAVVLWLATFVGILLMARFARANALPFYTQSLTQPGRIEYYGLYVDPLDTDTRALEHKLHMPPQFGTSFSRMIPKRSGLKHTLRSDLE